MDARRLIQAIASPLTLAVGAAGGATFVLSGLWWVLPLTAGAAAVISATQYRARDDQGLAGAYAAREAALLAQVKRIEATLAASKGSIRSVLADVPKQLEEMRGKVRRLLERQARIDAFVAETHPNTELTQLERARAAARTEDARERFASAIQNKRAEIDSRDGLRAQSERIAAELAEIESALGSTLSRIVAMEDLQEEAARESGQGISSKLGDVLATVDALEEALSEVFDPSRRRART